MLSVQGKVDIMLQVGVLPIEGTKEVSMGVQQMSA